MAEWYEQLLELQLIRNRDVWAGLQERGVVADTALRLGFIYVAPGESEAQALVDLLREETDYDVDVHARRDEGPADEDLDLEADPDPEDAWYVIGTTQPTPVTLELLDDWVEWMIAAGAAAGPCAFDGWAAQLVSG
jgi:hypothetical protein